MASAFSHVIAAAALTSVFRPGKPAAKIFLFAMFCSVMPDADVLAFKLGIPYEHPFGHRGFTHSLPFAWVLAIVLVSLFFRNEKTFSVRWWMIFLCLFLSGSFHAVLDAMTNGGLGVAFLFPFDNSRYFFPWRPIEVSPVSIGGFFSERGWVVLKS
jgi:inner membrane protein